MDALQESAGTHHRADGLAHLTMRRLQQRAHDLHVREVEGQSGETPFLAIAAVGLFLIPAFCVILGAALAAYYLS